MCLFGARIPSSRGFRPFGRDGVLAMQLGSVHRDSVEEKVYPAYPGQDFMPSFDERTLLPGP